MNTKYEQTYICAVSGSGAKHYLAVGTTKLTLQDLQSQFADCPTGAITKALDGLQPNKLIWVTLEQTAPRDFATRCYCVSAAGTRTETDWTVHGRDMRIGELADILVDDLKEESL